MHAQEVVIVHLLFVQNYFYCDSLPFYWVCYITGDLTPRTVIYMLIFGEYVSTIACISVAGVLHVHSNGCNRDK